MSNNSVMETESLISALRDALELERMLVNSLHKSTSIEEKQSIEEPTSSLHHVYPKRNCDSKYVGVEKKKSVLKINKALHNPIQSEYRIRKVEPNTFCFEHKKKRSDSTHTKRLRAQFVNNIAHERSIEELIRKVNATVRIDSRQQQHEQQQQKLKSFSSCTFIPFPHPHNNCVWGDKRSVCVKQQQEDDKSKCQHLQKQLQPMPMEQENEEIPDIANTERFNNYEYIHNSHVIDKVAKPTYNTYKQLEELEKEHFSSTKSFPTEKISAVSPLEKYNTNAYATSGKENKLCSPKVELEPTTQLESNGNNIASNYISCSVKRSADTLTKWRSMRQKMTVHRYNTTLTHDYKTVQISPRKQEKHRNSRQYALLSPALSTNEKNEVEEESKLYNTENDIDETVDISSLSESSVELEHSSEHIDKVHLSKKEIEGTHETNSVETYGNVHDIEKMNSNATNESSSVHSDNKQVSPTKSIVVCDNNIKSNTFSNKGRANKSEKTSVFSPPIALKELSCASSNVSTITTTASPSTAILLSSTLSDEIDREENSVGGANDNIKLSENEASKEVNRLIQPLHQSAKVVMHTKVSNCKDNVHDAYIEQQKRRAMCFAGSRQVEQENVKRMEGQLIKPLKLTRATFDERVETINELDAMTHKLIEQMIQLLLLQNSQKSNSSNLTHHCNTSNMLNSTLKYINNNDNANTNCEQQVLLLCRQYNIDYVDLTFPPVLSSLGVHHSHTSYSSLTHFTNSLSHSSTEQINGKVATPFAILWCPLSLYDQISNDNTKYNIAESQKYSASKVTCNSPERLIHPCAIRVGRLSDCGVAAALAALAESPSSLTHTVQLDKWCADQEWQLYEDNINNIDCSSSSCTDNNSIGRNIQSKERDLETNHNRKENKHKSIDCKEVEKKKKREEEQEDVELQLPRAKNTSFTNKMSTSANSSIHICYVWLCINGVWDQVGIDLFLPCVISHAITNEEPTTMQKETNDRKSCKEGNVDRISNTSCNLFYGCSAKAEFVKNVICQASSNASIDILLAKYWPCFIEKALAKVYSSTYFHRQVGHQVNIDLVSSNNNDIYNSIIKKEQSSCISSITANNHCECDSYQQLCNLHAAEVIAMLTGGPIEHWDEWWKHDSSLAFDEMESVTYEDTGKGKGILLLTTNKYLPSSYTDDTWWIKSLRPETTYRVLNIAQCEQTGEIVAALRIWHQEEECHSTFDNNFPLAEPDIKLHKEPRVNIDNYNVVNECYMSNDAHVISERNIDTTMHVTFDTNNENTRVNKVKDSYNNNSFKNELQDRSSVIELNYSTQILPYFSSCHVCYDCRHFNDIRLPIEFVKSAEHFDQTHATSSSASTYATPSHIIRIEIGENVHDKRTEECAKKGSNNEISGIPNNRRAHLWIGLYQPFVKPTDANCRHEEVRQSSSLESSLPELMSNNKSRISNSKGNHCHSVVEMKLSLVEDTTQGMQQTSAQHNATENSCARASMVNDSEDVFAEDTEEWKCKEERECQSSVHELNNNSCSSSECQFYKHHKRYCLLGESFGGAFRAWPSIWLDVEVDWSIPRVIYIIPQLRLSTGNDAAISDDMSKYHDEPMIYDDDDEDDAVNFSAMPSRMQFTSHTDDDRGHSKNSITNAATYTKSIIDEDKIGDNNDNNRIDKSNHVWCSTVALLTEQPEHFHITELHSPDELTAAIQHNLLTEVDYHHSELTGRKQRKFNEYTR